MNSLKTRHFCIKIAYSTQYFVLPDFLLIHYLIRNMLLWDMIAFQVVQCIV